MKAIIINQPGGTEQLKLAVLKTPSVLPNEVLVKVRAISINPVDVKTRLGRGLYSRLADESPFIPGWDISGTVVETGDSVTELMVGDEVFGMVNFPGHGKAYAEYVAAPAGHLALKPGKVSHEEAAASTLAALTAYQAIIHHAKVKAGQRVLIHAAAGGVGHFAVQIAKHAGAWVAGTSSAGKRDLVMSLGADEHVDYRSVRFEEVLSDIDFVLDTIGGDNIDRSLQVMKKGGTLISIPTGLNESVAQKAKAMGINGYSILVHSSGADMKELATMLDSGKLKAHVSQVFPFGQMAEAHKQVESGHTAGKVVVQPFS
ncbi:MAG: NADP-dependent oxidoreductase [Mangrovibacterium sp.]